MQAIRISDEWLGPMLTTGGAILPAQVTDGLAPGSRLLGASVVQNPEGGIDLVTFWGAPGEAIEAKPVMLKRAHPIHVSNTPPGE